MSRTCTCTYVPYRERIIYRIEPWSYKTDRTVTNWSTHRGRAAELFLPHQSFLPPWSRHYGPLLKLVSHRIWSVLETGTFRTMVINQFCLRLLRNAGVCPCSLVSTASFFLAPWSQSYSLVARVGGFSGRDSRLKFVSCVCVQTWSYEYDRIESKTS